MKSALLILVFFGSLPMVLIKPHIGVLLWDWISFMNPHRLTTQLYKFEFAQLIAIVTIPAWLISREPKRIPWTPVTVILSAFFLWTTMTTVFALQRDVAIEEWKAVTKMMIMLFVTLALINSKSRLHALIWVTVVSIGYFGVKGGFHAIVSGGTYPIEGPPDSDITSNNALAGALAMTIPLMRYLQLQAKSRWIVLAFWVALLLCAVAVFATYSRGGFLAFAAALMVIWLKSRHKVIIGAFGALGLIVALSFMPQEWYDRIESIGSYQEDSSSVGRIVMWKYGINVALARPMTGGGFKMFEQMRFYERFGLRICQPHENALDDCAPFGRASHSIYFDSLGEHGFVGLLLFVALLIAGIATGSSIARMTAGREDLAWMHQLAGMLQACIAAYAVMGLTQNATYFDLYYTLLAMMVITRMLASKAISEPSVSRAPADAFPGRKIEISLPSNRPPTARS